MNSKDVEYSILQLNDKVFPDKLVNAIKRLLVSNFHRLVSNHCNIPHKRYLPFSQVSYKSDLNVGYFVPSCH